MKLLKIYLWLLLATVTTLFAQEIDPTDPKWEEYVVGQIDQIQNKKIKDYLLDTHHNNQYAKKIAGKMEDLGPFSPSLDNVFWLPHIDVPISEENWRFLSNTHEMPDHLKSIAFIRINGIHYARMFIHPFTTERSHFIELANQYGGFKFQHQAVTTASVRSFVAWKTSKEKSDNFNRLDFPTNKENIFKTKVSIYNINIDGSRLNPVKKMVRAHAVSRLMNSIPPQILEEVGFEFEGEWLTGVPDGTDAGYAIREVLPVTRGDERGLRAEPGFSVLSSERLTQMTTNQENPLPWIVENIFSPLSRSLSYLLLEEGMIGENHTQNFDYVVDSNGIPTGRIILRDADAFRVNLVLRALNGKDVASISNLENPFFFLKDSAFSAVQNNDGDAVTLNYLLGYLINPHDETSMVRAVYNWCKRIIAYKSWCTAAKIKDQFLEELASDFSHYLKRTVSASELDYGLNVGGKVGLIKLFDERLNQVKNEAAKMPEDPRIQKILLDEYKRLNNLGHAKLVGSQDISLDNSRFILVTNENNLYINVVKKQVRSSSNPIQAIAIVGSLNDDKTIKFISKVEAKTNLKILKNKCAKLSKLFHPKKPQIVSEPVLRNLGGGNNI